jgi:hypothetical protein
MSSGFWIGNEYIKRKTITNTSIYHYTTKVIEVNNNKIRALDGYSLTDHYYIKELIPNNYNVIFRCPRYGNSAIIINSKDGIIIPQMSYDIMMFDKDATEYYLNRRIKNELGIKDVDDLINNAIIINEDGIIQNAKDVKPSYFPYIRELTYNKPDFTITLYTYDGEINKSIIDIYGKYYFNVVIIKRFFEKIRSLLFLGYVKDIIGIIPPFEINKIKIDPWRGHAEPNDINVCNEWIRLTNSEWCGYTSESEFLLKELQDALLELLKLGVFESLATIIAYTSNIFVTYVDFYVKKKNINTNIFEHQIKSITNKIQYIEVKEILQNVFQF